MPSSPSRDICATSLLAAAAHGLDGRYTVVINEFASALDAARAFDAIPEADATALAEIVVAALTDSQHPASRLREAAEGIRRGSKWIRPGSVRRTLINAARLSAARPYGHSTPTGDTALPNNIDRSSLHSSSSRRRVRSTVQSRDSNLVDRRKHQGDS